MVLLTLYSNNAFFQLKIIKIISGTKKISKREIR